MAAVYSDGLDDQKHSERGLGSLGGPYYIGSGGTGFSLKLNPKDARGYGLILCKPSHNPDRPYCKVERAEMYTWALEVEDFLRTKVGIPEVQIVQDESNMLCCHVICRGVEGHEYFPGVPLTCKQQDWSRIALTIVREALVKAKVMPFCFDERFAGRRGWMPQKLQTTDDSIRAFAVKARESQGFVPFDASGFWAIDGLLVHQDIETAPCQNGDVIFRNGLRFPVGRLSAAANNSEFLRKFGTYQADLNAFTYVPDV